MKTKNGKVPKQIWLSPEKLEKLKKEAERRGMSVASLMCSKLFS